MTSTTTTERPAYGLRKAIQAVKDTVTVEDYASNLTELRKAGNTLRGWCPIHQGDNPDAFAVYPEERRWQCFRCNAGGDVIDLAQAVEGGELWEAVVSISQRFNIEWPDTRTATWWEWQDQKGKVRATAKKHVAFVYQRRLTRVFAPLVLVGGETPEEALKELAELASALWPVSLDMAIRRVSGE